ncbi:MAG: arginase family protein [Glaciihabitans sp.]|nr:arginase family protein [Glaciihabitans sp.]
MAGAKPLAEIFEGVPTQPRGTLTYVAVTFLVVPQWQGSGSSRAMRLVDGAQAIRDDLPASATVTVDIPLEAGDSQGSAVDRLSSVVAVRDSQLQALNTLKAAGDWALTIGGDCGVELASIGAVSDRDDVAVLWFDAHPDLHTPDSSPSAAFHGMVLRTLLGDGDERLVPATPLRLQNVILVGTRAFEDDEAAYAAEVGLRSISTADFSAQALLAAVEASGATSIYVHIDLDVLDPAEIQGIGFPEPFGLNTAEVTAAIREVKARFPIVGAGITEFAPASPEQATDDLSTILRLIGALTR